MKIISAVMTFVGGTLGLGVWDLVIILALIGLGIVFYRQGNKKALKRLALYFVIRAEKFLGGGAGEFKKNQALTELYSRMPLILKFLFTRKELEEYIEEQVDKLKAYLSSGKTLVGYDDENLLKGVELQGKS